MRLIVNDTSVLIDLRKASLIAPTLLLPYRFAMALPLARTELKSFTPAEIDDLTARGLELLDLTPAEIGRAIDIRRDHATLSANDCFCLVLAAREPGSMILTGDASLRRTAAALGLDVHGVLWVIDELERGGVESFTRLHEALAVFRADPLVRLPAQELDQRSKRLARLMSGV